jgi:PAT family beta-lactamase induction signal transducer AmpG
MGFWKALSNKRMLVVLLMGFSSGLPLSLTSSLLQGWLTQSGLSLSDIGHASIISLPYSLKPFWAPIIDRYAPPIFGRRRGWMLIFQVALIITIFCISLFNPTTSLKFIALFAVLIAFFSASQDIVIDAYRVEILQSEEFGLGASLANMGYRLAALVIGGGIAMSLSDRLTWPEIYQLMGLLMIVGMVATLFADEPTENAPRSLREAVFLPLADFFRRPGIIEIAVFIFLYKLDAVFATALQTTFLIKLGFNGTEIGYVTKIYGFIATIAGTFCGGAAMVKIGLLRSLWLFGILQGIAGLSFIALFHVGHSLPMLIGTITTENFLSGMGTSAYASFLMNLCNKKFTGTQFALVSSIMALTRSVGNYYSGDIAEAYGWQNYFIISMLIAVPSLALLTRYKFWMKGLEQQNP